MIETIVNESGWVKEIIYSCSPIEAMIIKDAIRQFKCNPKNHRLDRKTAEIMLEDICDSCEEYSEVAEE